MNLLGIYEVISNKLKQINFNNLWEDFKPYRFAIYNDDEVILDGKKIPKTNEFIANTSIMYEGNPLAIWNVTNKDIDLDILTAGIVHEMFHAYQGDKQERRFPNDMEALVKYKYSNTNLNLKLAENKLLVELVKSFDQDKFDLFLEYRAQRKILDPYSFDYESRIEVIEGTAFYVELKALYELDKEKADKHLNNMLNKIINPNNFIPIRAISYDIGAIILKVLIDNNIAFNKKIHDKQPTYMEQLLKNISNKKLPNVEDVFSNIIEEDKKSLDLIIKKTTKVESIVAGNYKLYGCNVYDARYHKGYLLSKYFVAYLNNEEPVFLHGDFLVKMAEDFQISAIYKLIK